MDILYGAWSRSRAGPFTPARGGAETSTASLKRFFRHNDHVVLGIELTPLWIPHPQGTELPRLHDAHVAFLGRIDNRSELLARYQLPALTPDEVIVLHAYHERRTDCPALLVGEWAFALYDTAHDRFLLARDPVGTVPLYYAEDEATYIFATRIQSLLNYGLRTRPDERALAEITVGATRLEPTQTFLRDVNALPPGEALLIDKSGVRRKLFWDFQPRQTGIRTLREAGEAFQVVLRTAVARRMRVSASVAVQLSGGLDSSAVCCLAAEISRSSHIPPPIPLSYSATDGSAADERPFIAHVDDHTGLHTELIDLIPFEFLERAEENIRWAESPFLSQTPGAFARLVQAAQSKGAQVVLNGAFGDQVMFPFPPGHFVTLFRTLRWRSLWRQQRMIERWHTDVSPAVLRRESLRLLVRTHVPIWFREMRRRVRNPRPGAQLFGARMQMKLARGWRPAGAHLPHHLRPLYETLRSPYKVRALEAAMKHAAGLGATLSLPFLDRDVLQLLFSLPPELHYADGTPRVLLRTGLAGVVPAAVLARREKGDYTTAVRADIVRNVPAMLRELDNGVLLKRGIIDATEWRSFRSNWSRANVDLGVDVFYLGDLYGLELWHRRFHSD